MNLSRGLAYFLNNSEETTTSSSKNQQPANENEGRRSSSPSSDSKNRRMSREKDGFDNLDENITKSNDPKLILSRVFIGNLPTEKTNKEELYDLYKRYGKILGISIHKGFGFVQFAEENSALKAVEGLDKSIFKGNLLDLRISSKGRKQPVPNNPMPMKRPYEEEPMPLPYHDRDRDQFRMLDRGPPPMSFRDMPARDDPYFLDRYPPPGHGHGHPPPNHFPRPNIGMPPHEMYRDERDMFPPPPMQAPPPHMPPPPVVSEPPTGVSKKVEYGVERPFDAVIIVTQKTLKLYSEMVERRLLELNMVVDMIFLLNEKALNKAIDDMTCRGVLYIIVVQPQNEDHKSVTVNIMHGTPQEHRNMPLEDALVLLARNFNAYLSSLRCGSEQPTMGFLLNLLADGKHLSVAELDRIIAHLQDRRDRLIEAEGGRKDPVASSLNAASTTALQQKILSILSGSILNQPGGAGSGSAGGQGTATSAANAAPGGVQPSLALTNLAQQFGISMNNPAGQGQQQQPKIDAGAGGGGQPTPGQLEAAGVLKPNLSLSDPNVKKTIDSLLQNPNILKSLAPQGQQNQQKMGPPGGPQMAPQSAPIMQAPPIQPGPAMHPPGPPMMPPFGAPQPANMNFPGQSRFRY